MPKLLRSALVHVAPALAAQDADSFGIPPDRIKGVKPLLTIVGGRIVHAAAPFAR